MMGIPHGPVGRMNPGCPGAHVSLFRSIGMAKSKPKVTGAKAASEASKTLKSRSTAATSKSAAGSALAQTKTVKKTTSAAAAKAASKTLRDGRTGKASKSAAGSALAQTPAKKKRKK